METICVLDVGIGELTGGDRNHREFLDESVFLYNSCYHPVQGRYDRLEAIPLLIFTDSDWPSPDMATSVVFRARFREGCRSSIKSNTCYKATNLS